LCKRNGSGCAGATDVTLSKVLFVNEVIDADRKRITHWLPSPRPA
jgi:hypothetical protein